MQIPADSLKGHDFSPVSSSPAKLPVAMKLRLRSLKTEETIEVEVPSDFTFERLQHLLSQRFPSSSSSSSSSPSTTVILELYLNHMNRVTFNPEDTLPSLGIITPGIPLFCNLSSEIQAMETIEITIDDSKDNLATLPCFTTESSAVRETLDANIELFQTKPEEGDQNTPLENNCSLDMDIDESISELRKDFSVPFFLRKIFREEIGHGGVGAHRLIAIAVHAVLIESGFVAFDPVLNIKIERFHLPNELISSSQTLSLWYTLPEIIDEKMETVVLKFQGFGKYITIYGSLTKNGYGPYWARLDKNRLSFFLNLVWANFDLVNESVEGNKVHNVYPQMEVFEFWKTIKDKLALPLLIDLCERVGLTPPPCFMRLPTDLKLQILKTLSGNDIAKTACVCSELRYLSSNEDLWKQKYEEQFGSGTTTTTTTTAGQWKEKFGKSWESKSRMVSGGVFRRFPMIRNRPFHIWSPRRHVLTESRSGYGPHVRFYPGRGGFVPHCNLGGPTL